MIKVKITESGGYVVGDGPCPFNPDEFLVAFSAKIMEARLQGMTDLEIDPEVLREFKKDVKRELKAQVKAAPVLEFDDNISSRKLLSEVAKYEIVG
jgi:hypothetical protein